LQGLAIEAPESRNADLEARNADLGLRNGELSAQAAALEERLERLVPRDSGDSSMPSSSHDLPGRKAPGQRKRNGTGKRPEKKPGALFESRWWFWYTRSSVGVLPVSSPPTPRS
jgi:hypothetical protein